MSQDDSVTLTGLAIDDVKIDAVPDDHGGEAQLVRGEGRPRGCEPHVEDGSETRHARVRRLRPDEGRSAGQAEPQPILSKTGVRGGSYHYTYRGQERVRALLAPLGVHPRQAQLARPGCRSPALDRTAISVAEREA